MTSRNHTPHLVLFVRSLRPRQGGRRQRGVLDRLDELAAAGIADYTVVVWGRGLPPNPAEARTTVGRHFAEWIEVFAEWARRNGLSIDPAFPLRSTESRFTGEQFRARVLPQLTLAEFHGRALVSLAPAGGPDGVFTVEDRLDALAGGEPAVYRSVERALDTQPPEGIRTSLLL